MIDFFAFLLIAGAFYLIYLVVSDTERRRLRIVRVSMDTPRGSEMYFVVYRRDVALKTFDNYDAAEAYVDKYGRL